MEQGIHYIATGTCFDDAYEISMTIAESGIGGSLKVVHGICLDDHDRPYAHAWVEHNDKTLGKYIVDDQPTIVSFTHDIYKERMNVTDDVTRYNFLDYLGELESEFEKDNGKTSLVLEKRYIELTRERLGY